MGVAAHPDDLDFGASGTFARWVKEGAECYYLICTNGCKGSDDPKMTEKRLSRTRMMEQKLAAKELGLKGVFFLGHNDTELVADLGLKKEIVRFIRKLRPDVVVTMDPTFVYSKRGFINHSDHRAAGQATMDAVYPLSRDRLTFRELEKEGLVPHSVSTIYLINFEDGNEIVDITRTFPLKERALLCHKSQATKGALEWVKISASTIGRKKGYRYAESFVKLDLGRA